MNLLDNYFCLIDFESALNFCIQHVFDHLDLILSESFYFQIHLSCFVILKYFWFNTNYLW